MSATFARRQRVRIQTLAGPDFTPAWNERGTIIGEHPVDGVAIRERGWFVVRFDDGGGLSVHASRLMADNAPAFTGRLPTYASTQR